jgi:HAE1 family hydrophobic/amphiphilic exporter-1
MSIIGLIMLMGLVTKNAILLVDYAKVLRGRGMERREAVILAGRTRLRPIVMTTCAMIFGMLPLALGLGAGGEMRAPMARAVIGGLITSTLLTLVVVPVVYTLLDDLSTWLFGRRKPHAAAVATALLLAVLPARASAQAAAPGSQLPPGGPVTGVLVLTLDEALARAAGQNRDVQKAREYQKWVQGKYVEERAAVMPDVTFGLTALRQYDDTQSKLFRGISFPGSDSGEGAEIGEIFGGRQDGRVMAVSVSQPVFTWGQIGAAIRAARIGFQYADAQLRRFQQTVARDVSEAYYEVIASGELVGIAEENLAQKQRHLDETKRKLPLGTATDYDLLAAEVELENARPALIRAQNGVRISRERLRWLLAETTDVDVAPLPPVTVEPAPAYDVVLAQAWQHRPELAELRFQRDIFKELVTIEQSQGRPRVDFTAGVGTRWLGLPSISSSGTTWNAAIVATVPLFDGMRTKGRVAQARSDVARATLDEASARDGIAVEVRTAVDALREASEILGAIGGTVRQAERLVFLAEKGYELGVKTRLEVQDAQVNLLQARGNFARAERDYRVARVQLEWVSGILAINP